MKSNVDSDNSFDHMSDICTIRYSKPSLTNLPPEIGIPIFEQIMNTPKASTKELDQLDDAAAELADGMHVIPGEGKGINFRLKEVMRKREELGRPLTDEEFEEYIIHDDEN